MARGHFWDDARIELFIKQLYNRAEVVELGPIAVEVPRKSQRVIRDRSRFRNREIGQAVYALHCFQKKTERTTQRDIVLARKRLKDVLR